MKALNLFAYGTLQANNEFDLFSNERRIVQQAKLKNAKIYDLGCYPGLKTQGDGAVLGELHTYLDNDRFEDILSQIDWIEGYQGRKTDLFRREVVGIELLNGERVDAFTYVYNRSMNAEQLIKSGQWQEEKLCLDIRFLDQSDSEPQEEL
ncbi:MAG: gamma-glutamylcyclotransferase family protein [Candidatus Tenebribacter davisii]|nr:gamma-glutamylcyclotransferase family protein [Candidatus Tenebribacter davisii]